MEKSSRKLGKISRLEASIRSGCRRGHYFAFLCIRLVSRPELKYKVDF
jgi:hypothetical protein